MIGLLTVVLVENRNLENVMTKKIRKLNIVDGRVQDDMIHDAEVVGIEKNSDGSFSCHLISESKLNLEFKMNGIKKLIVNNLGYQNIILDLYISEGPKAKSEALSNSTIFNFRPEELPALNFNELNFVQIAPSNGIELLAICKSVELFEI